MLYVIVRYVLNVLEPPKVEILRTFRNIQLYICLYYAVYTALFHELHTAKKVTEKLTVILICLLFLVIEAMTSHSAVLYERFHDDTRVGH
jgi:hypothetical protein